MPQPTPTRHLTLLLVACAFAAASAAGAGTAAAQSVIVTHAPAGGAVELYFDNDRVQTATADQNGEATLAFALPAVAQEADVRVSTERCGDLRRVLLVERGLQPPQTGGACDRRDIPDVFVVQRVTTFVVDMQNPAPSIHVRQGPAPLSWLDRPGGPTHEGLDLPPAPKGIMVFGGAGFTASQDASSIACGSVTDCTAHDVSGTLSAGVGYWLTPIIGVQASYLRPGDITDNGTGDGFRFTSKRKTDLLMLSGTLGVPVGGFRIYGRGGANYHRATLSTTQTLDAGSSQNFELKTAGWGWQAAGGLEIWVKSWAGFYVDGGVAKIQGNAIGGAEGSLDDTLIFGTVGLRIRIGR